MVAVGVTATLPPSAPETLSGVLMLQALAPLMGEPAWT